LVLRVSANAGELFGVLAAVVAGNQSTIRIGVGGRGWWFVALVWRDVMFRRIILAKKELLVLLRLGTATKKETGSLEPVSTVWGLPYAILEGVKLDFFGYSSGGTHVLRDQ
jgi:hypothetical protein